MSGSISNASSYHTHPRVGIGTALIVERFLSLDGRLLRNNCKLIKLFILIKVYYRITHVDKSTTNVHNFI